MRQKQTSINREVLIDRASKVGIFGNAVLALIKIVAGAISGSVAVIGDGVDSAADIVSSIITNYANRVSVRPPDKKHPWGYARIETIATKVISILILFAGLQLVFSSVGQLFNSEAREIPSTLAIIVTIFSMLGKAGLSFYQNYLGTKANSEMVKADAVHMRNDIYLSLAVLVGLVLTQITQLTFIDSLLGIGLGLFIIWNGAKMSLESNHELMDSFDDQEKIYDRTFAAIEKVEGAENPHRVRIRKINTLYDIVLDIEVDGELKAKEAHKIAQAVEKQIKTDIKDIFDVVVHIDIKGEKEDDQFGLRPNKK